MATDTLNIFHSFPEALAEKVHNFESDQIVVALCATANAPIASNTILANLTQIAYTNASSRNVTTTSSGQTSGTYSLILTDLVLTATGGALPAFQYVVLYNDTATNDELIGWLDYGAALTMAENETLTINFPVTAVFSMAPV